MADRMTRMIFLFRSGTYVCALVAPSSVLNCPGLHGLNVPLLLQIQRKALARISSNQNTCTQSGQVCVNIQSYLLTAEVLWSYAGQGRSVLSAHMLRDDRQPPARIADPLDQAHMIPLLLAFWADISSSAADQGEQARSRPLTSRSSSMSLRAWCSPLPD
jgi:hypothetical protein